MNPTERLGTDRRAAHTRPAGFSESHPYGSLEVPSSEAMEYGSKAENQGTGNELPWNSRREGLVSNGLKQRGRQKHHKETGRGEGSRNK